MKFDLYTRLHLWLVAHRRAVLAATLLVTVISIVISLRIDLDEDILAILPQGGSNVGAVGGCQAAELAGNADRGGTTEQVPPRPGRAG